MPSPTAGPLRMLRSGLLACVVLSLSLTAHLVAGGLMPGWTTLLVLAAAVGGGCTFLTRRRLSPQALLGVMAASQLVLHEVLMLPARFGQTAVDAGSAATRCTDCMAGMAGMPGMAGMTGTAGMHGMAGTAGRHGMTGMHGMTGTTGGALGASVLMLLCHALAALLLAGLLGYGEALLWQLWCWLTSGTLRLERREELVQRHAAQHPGRTAVVPATLLLLEGDPRRGPPRVCAPAA